MGKSLSRRVLGVGVLLILLVSLVFPGQVGAENNRFFEVTGHNVSGEFLQFFDSQGGLDMFGYPRTEAIREGDLLVQYFQRNRMEFRPGNPDPYKVELMLIGDVVYGGGQEPISLDLIPPSNDSNRRYYPETGHILTAPFKDYYDSHGGLVFFGYPTTEQYQEGGYTVQLFQRARLESHPGNPDPYKIQLGLLGDQYIFDQGKVARMLTIAVPPARAISQPSVQTSAPAIVGASFSAGTGGRLVFQTSNGGDIYIVNADGTGLRRLTDGVDPSWSPDGRQITFSRWIGEEGIYVMNVDSGEPPRRVFDVVDAQSPVWSPDGAWIAFSYPRDGFTFKFNRATGRFGPADDQAYVVGAVKLADGSGYDFAGPAHSYTPSWSPDGKNVVFKGDRSLFIAGLDDSSNPVLNTDTRYTMPAWSPDGTKILFQYLQNNYWQVGTISVDGNGMRLLTSIDPLGPSANNMSAVWSPDGKYIAFASDREGAWRIYVMNADGSNQRKLVDVSIVHEQNFERTVAWSK